jgi:hypothetical protein
MGLLAWDGAFLLEFYIPKKVGGDRGSLALLQPQAFKSFALTP